MCPNLINIFYRFSGQELAIRVPQALQRGRQVIVALRKFLNPGLNLSLNDPVWNSGWWHVARTHKCRSYQRFLCNDNGVLNQIFHSLSGNVFVTHAIDSDGPVSRLFIPPDLKV